MLFSSAYHLLVALDIDPFLSRFASHFDPSKGIGVGILHVGRDRTHTQGAGELFLRTLKLLQELIAVVQTGLDSRADETAGLDIGLPVIACDDAA